MLFSTLKDDKTCSETVEDNGKVCSTHLMSRHYCLFRIGKESSIELQDQA
jgi:hypothetical protein